MSGAPIDERLSAEEMQQLARLLRRFVDHDVDQFCHLKLTGREGFPWYISISRWDQGDPSLWGSLDSDLGDSH